MPEELNNIPLYTMIPFVLMLGSIAVLPLFAHHFWERNRNKLIVSITLSTPTAIWLIATGHSYELEHILLFDYLPFMALLGALFVITGGIYLHGTISDRPLTNTTTLAIGGVLASFMGTTGAAMLLIRPFIRANDKRRYKVHSVLFFIAIVANSGGLLTPLGDPPLFMMYLRGAEFIWFAGMFKEWLFVNGLLLFIYFAVDTYYFKKEDEDIRNFTPEEKEPLRIEGKFNLLLILFVVLAVAFLNGNTIDLIKENQYYSFIRDGVLVILTGLSVLFTKKNVREMNRYSWEPINEVSYLFIGIFVTMAPALMYLQSHASSLGLDDPTLFYYATGFLSGFLDNTPTAITFYYVALGIGSVDPSILANTTLVAGIPESYMIAICTSAVFFGSMTYIGNGPNFMIRAIAVRREVKMPDFFAYFFKFGVLVLLPVYILAQLIFI